MNAQIHCRMFNYLLRLYTISNLYTNSNPIKGCKTSILIRLLGISDEKMLKLVKQAFNSQTLWQNLPDYIILWANKTITPYSIKMEFKNLINS